MNPAVQRSGLRGAPGGCRGAILFEILLALVLFLGVVAVVTSGMNASVEAVDRQRWELHAVNLAVTVLSEIQLGLRSTTLPGPELFPPPYEDWTWQLGVEGADDEVGEVSGLSRVSVLVRHANSPVTFRLVQVMRLPGRPATLAPGVGGVSP